MSQHLTACLLLVSKHHDASDMSCPFFVLKNPPKRSHVSAAVRVSLSSQKIRNRVQRFRCPGRF
jgi:hypothetical protein